jgi:hypothetical protein
VINQTTTGEHHMRIWSRAFVLLLSLVAALGAGAANLIAQQRLSGVPVPIAGTTNIGGTFSGTLFIQSFAVQGSVLSGTGVVNGVLNDPTGTRPLVAAQVTVPVDLATARARRNTDVALIAAPCELVHLEFAPAAFIVLGSRVALERTAVDITSAQGSAAAQPAASAAQPNVVVPSVGTAATSLGPAPTSINAGDATLTPMALPGSLVAGTITTPIAPPAAPPTDVGALLCSASRLGDTAADRTQLAQLLNQILTALA